MIRRTGVVIVAILLVHAAAAAEVLLEEREGVLYVKNVEPPQPPPAVAAPSSSPPGEPVAAKTAAPYRGLIRAAAARHRLASELIESVIRVESNFEPRAVSSKGARGLMQLMPKTARLLGVRNVFDARQNIEGGARHLRNLVDRYNGNLTLALAAYNAGADAVARHGGIPPYAETRAYVARVLKLLQRTGLPVSAEAAEAQATLRAEPAAAEARTLYCYEAADGRAVYSNLPIDRLSSAVRAMLEGRE